MAKWNQQALKDLNQGVTSSQMTRAQAKAFESQIDTWAGAVGAFQVRRFDSPSGQGSFEVKAESGEVIGITYDQ